MRTFNTEYYGDDVRWFVGTVIDNTPPYGLEGRVQIRIHGIHTDTTDKTGIPQRDLPWAQVMNPGDTYGVSGLGTSAQILPGALVFGFFLDGVTSQLPMVLGSLPRIEFPTSVQASDREDPASNPFAYSFVQSNAEAVDPAIENSGPLAAGEVARYFIDNGFNAKQASSITGVLQEISNLDPYNTSNGIGIAGWIPNSPRYHRFYAYIGRLAPIRDAFDMEGQLLYVLHELKTARSIALSKMLRAREIEGNLYGEKIDGIEEKGNGQVAALVKYYVDTRTACSQGSAIGKAKAIYGGLGAR
jgi:hypothetical protein